MATNDAWLDQITEAALEPNLPICDTHHHLWDQLKGRVEPQYLLDEFQKDLQSGHTIVSNVFVGCSAMCRADGPEDMKPIGEVEFVNGIAAMAASGLYGETQVAAAIIGHAALEMGSRVKGMLERLATAVSNRFRGIRRTGAWDADPTIEHGRNVTGPGLYFDTKFREGFAELAPLD